MTHDDTASEEPQEKVKTILVVEDDGDIADFIVEVLKDETPYHFKLVKDGLEALDAVKTLVPDLFVLDFQLPHINGLTLYDHFQGREELKHIPALLMSANLPMKEVEKRGMYSIEKPFQIAELLRKIEEIFAAS